MDDLAAIWAWFATFPVELAVGSMSFVMLFYVLTALVIVFWRRSPRVTIVTLMAPFGFYGVAWGIRWLAETDLVAGSALASWLWLVFSILMLVSLVWSFINLLRVLVNK